MPVRRCPIGEGSFQNRHRANVDDKIDGPKKVRARRSPVPARVYYDLVNAAKGTRPRTSASSASTTLSLSDIKPSSSTEKISELYRTSLGRRRPAKSKSDRGFRFKHNVFDSMTKGQKACLSGRPATRRRRSLLRISIIAQQKALIDTAFSKLKALS